MRAHTSIKLVLSTSGQEVDKVLKYFAEQTCDNHPFFEKLGSNYIIATDQIYKIVWLSDVTTFAEGIAKLVPDVAFEITGTIDTSESAGEYMDYCITYQEGKLIRKNSQWYLRIELYDFLEDPWTAELLREEFNVECTEEEFEHYKQAGVVYVLENSSNFLIKDNTLADKVPLTDMKEILLAPQSNIPKQ